MIYKTSYDSPLGSLLLLADEKGLTGLWFEKQKHFAYGRTGFEADAADSVETRGDGSLPLLSEAERWLDLYFAGKKPDFDLPINLSGTEFQKKVWKILCTIPYGATMTYGQIAAQLAAEQGITRMSAQAIGGAVGHNPLSIIVPCHRVVGSDGSLTGYAGGIDKKVRLLELEKTDMTKFFIPKRGTAL